MPELVHQHTEEQKRWLSWNIVSGNKAKLTPFGTKHSYEGTADPNKLAKRRAKNKVAKASRRKNR